MAKMPPQLGEASEVYYRAQAQLSKDTSALVERVWRSMEGDNFREKSEWFQTIGLPAVSRLIRNGQFLSLNRTQQYMVIVAAIQEVEGQALFNPEAFIYDAKALETVLESNMYRHIGMTLSGVPELVSMRLVSQSLVRATSGAVQDAGRDAISATIASGGYYGFVRKLQLPSCKRCVVLAGKEFRTNEGFDRHDLCDCVHVPVAESYDDATTDPIQAIKDGQVTGLSKRDTEAILEYGADVSQVINSSSGLVTENILGTKVKATTVGKSSRAVAGSRLGNLAKQQGSRYKQSQNTRLSVGQILKLAGGDQGRAKEMLFNHGFII